MPFWRLLDVAKSEAVWLVVIGGTKTFVLLCNILCNIISTLARRLNIQEQIAVTRSPGITQFLVARERREVS